MGDGEAAGGYCGQTAEEGVVLSRALGASESHDVSRRTAVLAGFIKYNWGIANLCLNQLKKN